MTTGPTLTRADRIGGGLVGLLVGDALGVPYEFHDPHELPAPEQIDFDPPAGFWRAHAGTPPGTWSDDGAQALCLLASLLDRGRLDLKDLASRLLRWRCEGYMAVDGRVFDCGITTARALAAVEAGRPARGCGPAGENDNGNGSLMRVLPLALWHGGSDADLAADACEQSLVTHGHPRSQVCCALYCLWARRLLEGTDPAAGWDAAAAAARAAFGRTPLGAELEGVLGWPGPGRGTGYVVDTLHSTRLCLRAPTYEAAVKKAVALGHDTDTTACVAGGLAGIAHGTAGIPLRWRQHLRGYDELAGPLVNRLLQATAASG